MEREGHEQREPTELRQQQEGAPPREVVLTTAVEMLLDALDRCGGDDPDCPHCGPARAFALQALELAPSAETPEQRAERLTLRGRAGTEPSFRTTRNGTPIARFPLAVRDDAGDTEWHTVVTFGDRAERLRDVVHRGAVVEVIGYLHERTARARGGRPRVVQELYAAVVRPLT